MIDIDNDEDFDNIILNIDNAYVNLLSIMAIKIHFNVINTFSIQEISETYMGNIIPSLNPSKKC